MVTLTNGVSFELVTGVCCFISFSNAIYAGSGKTTRITININSTGAKNLTIDRGTNEASYSSNNYPKRYGIYYITQVNEITGNALYTYNGTNYITPIISYTTYVDYSDYSD